MAREQRLDEFESIFRASLTPSVPIEPLKLERLLGVLDWEGNAAKREGLLACVRALAEEHRPALRMVAPLRELKSRPNTPPVEAATEQLDAQAHHLWQLGLEVSHEVQVGSPSSLILEQKASFQPTLLVLSSLFGEDEDGLEGYTLGSVVDRVLEAMEIPLLLVEGPVRPEGLLDRWLITVDNEASTPPCLNAAAGLARRGASVTLHHVLDESILKTYRQGIELAAELDSDKATAAVNRALCNRMEHYLKGAAQSLEKCGLKVDVVVEVGDPLHKIRARIAGGDYGLVACNSVAPDEKLIDSLAYNLAAHLRELPLLLV